MIHTQNINGINSDPKIIEMDALIIIPQNLMGSNVKESGETLTIRGDSIDCVENS